MEEKQKQTVISLGTGAQNVASILQRDGLPALELVPVEVEYKPPPRPLPKKSGPGPGDTIQATDGTLYIMMPDGSFRRKTPKIKGKKQRRLARRS